MGRNPQKYEQLDGVIIGGSNDGIWREREILSTSLGEFWVNASLLYEGFSDANYDAFLSETFSVAVRSGVKTVVVSSLSIHFKGKAAERKTSRYDLYGRKPFDHLPQRNLIGYLTQGLRVQGSRYPAPDQYGDFKFEGSPAKR